jgi:hypothetical protein
MNYRTDGYGHYTQKATGTKFYFAVTKGLMGRSRMSRAKFKRGRDAEAYGIRLVEKYNALKAAEIVTEGAGQ